MLAWLAQNATKYTACTFHFTQRVSVVCLMHTMALAYCFWSCFGADSLDGCKFPCFMVHSYRLFPKCLNILCLWSKQCLCLLQRGLQLLVWFPFAQRLIQSGQTWFITNDMPFEVPLFVSSIFHSNPCFRVLIALLCTDLLLGAKLQVSEVAARHAPTLVKWAIVLNARSSFALVVPPGGLVLWLVSIVKWTWRCISNMQYLVNVDKL